MDGNRSGVRNLSFTKAQEEEYIVLPRSYQQQVYFKNKFTTQLLPSAYKASAVYFSTNLRCYLSRSLRGVLF